MTSPDEDTDPHASDAPPSLSGEEQFRTALSSLLDVKLKPVVDVQLSQNQRQTKTEDRVSQLEKTRFVLPIALSTAALIVAALSLVIASRTVTLGLW